MLSALESSPAPFHEWRQNGISRSQFFERERCIDMFQQILDGLAENQTASAASSLAGRLIGPSPVSIASSGIGIGSPAVLSPEEL